jgi:hypothetical protein
VYTAVFVLAPCASLLKQKNINYFSKDSSPEGTFLGLAIFYTVHRLGETR